MKFLLNMIGMCSSEGRVGQQEREEEDKALVVRRLEKIMKNKSSMLFALSSLLLQKSEAVNVPLAAAQEAQSSKPPEVPGTGSMSLLEILVANGMVAVAVYALFKVESKSAKTSRKKTQKDSDSEDSGSSSSEGKKKKNRRKRQAEKRGEEEEREAPAAQVNYSADAVDEKVKRLREERSRRQKRRS